MTFRQMFYFSASMAIALSIIYELFFRKVFPMKEYFTPYFKVNDEKTLNEFALWAFGPDFERLSSKDLANRWNDLHGDEHYIDLSRENGPEKDAPIMLGMWMRRNE